MRTPVIAVMCALLAASTAAAQRHKLGTIDAATPEGALLQQIGMESDDARKAGLLEQFAAKFPKHEGIAWVYEMMIGAYTKTGATDKALEAGDKLMALDPSDAEDAYACLQAAEARKDADQVVKWSGLTSAAARKLAASPQPKEEEEVENWKARVDFAKQVDIRTEYSLYAMLLQTPDPKKRVLLGEALERQNPQSQYIIQMAEALFQAYIQAGESAKAVAFAERIVEKDQSSPEMLVAVADGYRAKKQPDKAAALTAKAIEVAEGKVKPQGVSDADWATWKTQIVGRAHFVAGMAFAAESRWQQTDHELRAALPALTGNQAMLAEALFQLGVANFRLGEKGDTERIGDAVRFSEKCAAIPGPFQAPARQNVKAIRARYHVQ